MVVNVSEAEDSAWEQRQLVATAGAILHHEGLIDYLGHCSARVPGTESIVIKPKHSVQTRSPERLGPKDMIVIDLDGRLLQGAEKPPAELFIHTEIYRNRPDVTAIVHTHQPAATLLGILGAELKPILHVPAVLADRGRAQRWECPLLVTDADLGGQAAAALGDGHICHLVGHGVVVVDSDLRRATVSALALEQLAEANLRILETGGRPRVISNDELDKLSRTVASVDGRWAYYMERLNGET